MKKYDKYKDSGIEWIGEIPEHWNVKVLKRLAKICNGQDHKNVWDENGLFPIIGTGGEFGKANQYLHQGASVILGRKGTIDKPQFIEAPFWSVDTAYYTDIKSDVSPKLFYYLCKTINFDLYKYGSAVPSMTQEALNQIPFSIPVSLEEQTAIANYLDRKTAEIDELIADKKRLLELYKEEKIAIINHAITKGINPVVKMKDSGIEWLGEIPEHWEVKRIRHVAQIFGRIGYRGYKTTDLVQKGEGAITISPSNMKGYYMDFSDCSYLSWEKYEESPEIMIFNGDILFVKTGSTYGKSSLVENLPEKATINPQIIVLKEIQCNNKLLWYIIKSEYTQFQVEGTVVGGTIPTISQAKINNYEFTLTPDSKEQQSIVHYIETECSRIDAKISRTEKLIDLLTEYRTALISEVVTGKINVLE